MHLGNMILVGDAITVFDCIEFNEDLRWIDVLSEVAFCVMDLEDRGRPDLARRFLNSYLESSGDYGGLAVFRLYLVYRATVRAKVTRIRQTQSRLQGDEQERLNRELENYLELADRCEHGRLSFLAITHGLSGSGKTWGSQALVEKSGAIRVRSDVERKRLAGLSERAKSGAAVDGGIYAKHFSARTYERLADLASAIIRGGFPAIVDATFLRRSHRRRFRMLAEKLGVPFKILDFPTPEAICRGRIQRRALSGTDASEASETILDRQLQRDEPLDDEERTLTYRIDASGSGGIERLLSEFDGTPTHTG
jgi:predicted kinase